jgi:hypothetical protein
MNLRNILAKTAVVALGLFTIQSCKKENGIDNNNVITRPYSLFASDTIGTIVKTNDGKSFTTAFPGDGRHARAIVVSGPNVVMIKNDQAYYSENNGNIFLDVKLTNYQAPIDVPWNSFIKYVQSHNRIIVTNVLSGVGQTSYSNSNGQSYMPDTNYVPHDKPNALRTFAQLDNGNLFGFSPTGSINNFSALYMREGVDEPWKPVETDLPMPFEWQLTNYGNSLIAYDYNSGEGAYYSTDNGKKFNKISGLPLSTKLTCAWGGFEIVVIGTPKGAYLYKNGKFEASNSGLDVNTAVYGVVGKQNIYKNNETRNFLFLATSTGLYKSEDLGRTWVKVRPGIFTAIG